jgi:NADPH:quinone reductase-like Zn-dependent oxidoreductase
MAGLFDSGVLKTFVKAEVQLENAASAHAGCIAANSGKIVIRTI